MALDPLRGSAFDAEADRWRQRFARRSAFLVFLAGVAGVAVAVLLRQVF